MRNRVRDGRSTSLCFLFRSNRDRKRGYRFFMVMRNSLMGGAATSLLFGRLLFSKK